MTAFVTRDASHLGVDRIATSPTAFALYENVFALAEGSVGAPRIQSAALQDLLVTESKLAASAVAQGKLKTANGEVSNNTGGDVLFTLPGGAYGFYPQIYASSVGGQGMSFTIGGFSHPGTAEETFDGVDIGTTLLTRIHMLGFSGQNARAQQRYIQASPPYDLGDGQVPLFIFAILDVNGNVMATYAAEDPPWANNGPTIIRPDGHLPNGSGYRLVRPRVNRQKLLDPASRVEELERIRTVAPQAIEITQEIKQADMPLIPHPFTGNDLTSRTVVLLDPVSNLVHRLSEMHLAEESMGEMLAGGYLHLDNVPMKRASPPGVMPVAVRWK